MSVTELPWATLVPGDGLVLITLPLGTEIVGLVGHRVLEALGLQDGFGVSHRYPDETRRHGHLVDGGGNSHIESDRVTLLHQ